MLQAEVLVKDVFPNKVVFLDNLMRTEQLSINSVNDFVVDLNVPHPSNCLLENDGPAAKKLKLDNSLEGSKVYALPNGEVTCNEPLSKLIDQVKPLLRDLIEHANQIKMWITYLIPRIEDGNNFGVSIQEDTIAEARQVESDAATYLDQVSRYFLTRAKIVTKLAKYPHVQDYRRAIQELDEKEFLSLRLVVCELRNHYCSLHDMILKNIDKIKKPRSCNAENLY
ncbi:DgyrCDS216 [Dimorphilus gyrociliatus]|uniref:DgyrCDS216 n=1 Tax=Dimorphilus gyrociliatus TaxID=2664684 RepID=A0A7I8V5E8_9ANNE|nr:DgyrCDS216 [Dimorphilus gyrociliatus]